MLNDQIIKYGTTGGKDRRYFCGEHLDFCVFSNGNRYFYARYTSDHKIKRIFLGSYPTDIKNLSQAEKLRDEALTKVNLFSKKAEDSDVVEEILSENNNEGVVVELESLIFTPTSTFSNLTDSWLKFVYSKKASPKTVAKVYSLYQRFVYPYIGKIQINKIQPLNITTLVNKLSTLPTQQIRVLNLVSRVFDFAILRNALSINPCYGLSKLYKNANYHERHHPSVEHYELPGILDVFLKSNVHVECKLLFLFQLCSLLRSSEVVLLEWRNVVEKQKLIIIPPEKMKMKRPFKLPLSPLMIEILHAMMKLRTNPLNPYVFGGIIPQDSKKHVSRNYLSIQLRKFFKDVLCSHGLRSMGRGWLVDSEVPYEVAEMMLSHQIGNKVAAAYLRSDMVKQRSFWIDKWSEYIQEQDMDGDIARLLESLNKTSVQ